MKTNVFLQNNFVLDGSRRSGNRFPAFLRKQPEAGGLCLWFCVSLEAERLVY